MIEFRVKDMTCGHCANAVAQAIRSIDPYAHMEVDLLTRKVKVESTAQGHALSAALLEAGYSPS